MAGVPAHLVSFHWLECGQCHAVGAFTLKLPGLYPHLVALSSFDQNPAVKPVGCNSQGRRIRHDVLNESLAEDVAAFPDFHEGAPEVLPSVMAVGGYLVPIV